MRVLILGLNYLPESTSIGPYTADLAEYLIANGHEVQVITGFPQAPQWKTWDGYRGKRFMREVINGVPVLRTYLYVPKHPKRALQRILFDTSFMVSSFLGALLTGPCDLVVAVSPPLELGLTAWVVSLLKRVPFFLHVQDLVPDAAIAVGALSENSKAVRIARTLERFVYGRAVSIGVICDGFMRNLAGKSVPSAKVKLLPNYIDLQSIQPYDSDNDFRRAQGMHPDDFVVMYSGSVSAKQGLHTFVQAAAQMVETRGVVFYLIGDGPYLGELRELAAKQSLNNIRFLPLQPREGLSQQLSAANALVVTQRRSVTDVVFPGKLLYYMAAGRPIVAAVSSDSETGSFLASHEAGIVTPPEDAVALARAIGHLHAVRTEAVRLGRNGRIVAEEKFDRSAVLASFAEHLERLATKA